MNEYEEAAAARGAALLDRERPGWHRKIDLGVLELASTSRCVLGQLFDTPRVHMLADSEGNEYEVCDANYALGVEVLGLDDQAIRTCGFDTDSRTTYAGLDEAWALQVKNRFEKGL